MTREERAAADPATLSTQEVILRLVDIAWSMADGHPDFGKAAEEGIMRASRLDNLQRQCAPDRNDYKGTTPDQIMAMVNAPSPQ